jgi:hypothetical protein
LASISASLSGLGSICETSSFAHSFRFGADCVDGLRDRNDGLFVITSIHGILPEKLRIGRLMSIVAKTKRISNRRNCPLNSRARISDRSQRRFFIVSRNKLARSVSIDDCPAFSLVRRCHGSLLDNASFRVWPHHQQLKVAERK